jgi:1-aminocyclopropane-1-carboxylate deaminase/D-cysteine desulfhydrase-like pyridoxal-dependent ACC family enzyme
VSAQPEGRKPLDLALGAPSPVWRFSAADLPGGQLWVKDDGKLHPMYGGNKVRKLGRLLERARRGGARRILTGGAAGSHHVLATTLFARLQGLSTAAALGPQPWSEHAEQTLACAVGYGLEPFPVPSSAEVMLGALEQRGKDDFFVPVGGWGVDGSLGWVEAARELLTQVRSGALPRPDVIVAALGCGGTVAGLLAGLAAEQPPVQLIGASVFTRSRWMALAQVLPLAHRLTSVTGQQVESRHLLARLQVDTTELGPGYGTATPASAAAAGIGARAGLELDPTYTSKAFSLALRLLRCPELPGGPAPRPAPTTHRSGPLCVLYWHTLSSVPLESLLCTAPRSTTLDASLLRLFRRA